MKSGNYYSRLQRNQERFTQRQIVLFLGASLLLLVILVYFGVNFLFNLSSRISGLKSKVSTTSQTQDQGLAPTVPVLSQDYIATSSGQIKVTGVTDPQATVELFQNSASDGTQVADSQGKFSFDVTLNTGSNTFWAQATSDKGAKSGKSDEYVVQFQTTAPKLDLSVNDGDSFKNNPVTISGKTDAGNSVTVNDHLIIVNADGGFSYQINLNGGDNKIKIVATDQAGNQTTKEITLKFSS